ncbi:10589_t:CDS:2 [Acaulospora colombiana]|uniref:10589_t:CDS:1 n=1 Tax=Acaulospora colombiana TaxID=27376 RepID=A0ACA9LTA3_9GLOM|nr:10589_t:CDS:2 [Acaulospora colombiana]
MSIINSSALPSLLKNHYILLRHGQSKANVAGVVVSKPENGCAPASLTGFSPGSCDDNGGWGLTELGKEQAKNAARNILEYLLTSHRISGDTPEPSREPDLVLKIYTSPFSRALETASIVHDYFSNYIQGSEGDLTSANAPRHIVLCPTVTTVQDLRERNFGIYEFKTSRESYNKVWELDNAIECRDEDDGYDDILKRYIEVEVENCQQVQARMCGVVRKIELNFDFKETENIGQEDPERITDGRRETGSKNEPTESVAILVGHGDPLKILQASFEGMKPTAHRKLSYLGNAEWRFF